jgi:Ca2+-binding RTX toxin-like protein
MIRNLTFKPVIKTDYTSLAEILAESSQDNSLDGFVNLGAGDNFHFRQVTTAQRVNAQGGDDTVILQGNTNDTVKGGSGNDFIDGGHGNDVIEGGSGNDNILGGAGADIIKGGSGADFLAGDNDAVASSQHGIDTINGGSGNDTIYGGGKADVLTGGTGNDTFLYKVGFGSGNESKVGEADTITDFQVGDRIDVSFMDADGNSANGNGQFNFLTGPSNAAGSMWIEDRADGQHVFFNLDGGAADMEIIVKTAGEYDLSASDFLL